MKIFINSLITVCVLSTFLAVSEVQAQGNHELKQTDKIEMFLQHVGRKANIETEAFKSLILEYELARSMEFLGSIQMDLSGENFIEKSLSKLDPKFKEALDQFKKDPKGSEALFKEIALSPDPYPTAHALLKLSQIAFEKKEFGEALELSLRVTRNYRRFLLLDTEACLLAADAYRELKKPLLEYLQLSILMTDYPEISEKMKEEVQKRIAQLQAKITPPVKQVSNWMENVEDLLDKTITAEDPTRNKQEDISSVIEKMIALQEAKERNACGNCSGKGGSKPGNKPGNKKGNNPSSPAENSQLANSAGETKLGVYSNADPNSIWGLLKERQGAEALQSFQTKLPSRYQKLLQQYYKGLSKQNSSE